MIRSRSLLGPSAHLITLIALGWACSSDDDSGANGSGGSGTGAAGSGAEPATGGASGAGGTAGTPATGGRGGTPATGGAGGEPPTGGTGGGAGEAGSGGMNAATGGAGGEPATGGGGGRAPETDGGGSDAAPPIAYMDYCGCSFAAAEDHTGQTALTVNFGGAYGEAYSPKCIKVSAGTDVTFSGDASEHPFGPAPTTDPGNPVTNTGTGTSATFAYSTAGTFGYFCLFHGTPIGQGMCGVVYVVP